MDTAELIRETFKTAHEWLEATMADVTPEVAQWIPPGEAHPVGSLYAHVLVTEDNGVARLRGTPALAKGAWLGRTGIPDAQLPHSHSLDWARTVQLDLAALRQYAQAVYANTDDYLAGLTEADLEAVEDLSGIGMGQWSRAAFLITFMLGHVRDLMGEISAIKGVQGLKGYPF